jgi:flagellar motor switch protein FliG
VTTTTDEAVTPAATTAVTTTGAATSAVATTGAGPAPRPSAALASAGLSNRQKVAVLLAQLGTQKAAPILKEMTDDEAITLTTEMVGLPPLSTEAVVEVVAEFLDRISRSDLVSQGGLDLARELLAERLGQTRAQEVMDQIEGQQSSGPLSGLLRVDPQQALAVLGEQQPQVVAVLLAYLPPEDAASLLSELDPTFRVKVAKRIAKLTRVDPAAIRQATALLEGKLRNSRAGGTTTLTGGTTAMAEILNHSDRSVEQQILSELEGDDQELAEQIRSKLFTFDDVVQLDDKSLQQIFRKMDVSTLALAMKGPQLSPEALVRIRSNLSERVTTMIDEEMEVMGTVRNSQINSAQAMIVRTARQLDAEGIIVIARDGEVVV